VFVKKVMKALDGIRWRFLLQVSGVGKTFLVKSTDFYRQILGISAPWKIVNVELDMEAKRVVITAEVDRATKWAHPETKQAASLHKWTERTWRHLDTCQFETVIKANGSISCGLEPVTLAR
jgi:hypothetical protein